MVHYIVVTGRRRSYAGAAQRGWPPHARSRLPGQRAFWFVFWTTTRATRLQRVLARYLVGFWFPGSHAGLTAWILRGLLTTVYCRCSCTVDGYRGSPDGTTPGSLTCACLPPL